MEKSKAILILKTFDPEEMKEFELFLASPLFNSEPSIIKLFQYLYKYYPDFEGSNLIKEKAYQRINPGKEYSDGTMRNLLSKLYRLSEEYLEFKHFRKDGYQRKQALLRELSNRKLPRIYEKKYREFIKYIDGIDSRDEEYYLKKFYAEQDLVVHIKGQKSSVFLEKDNAQEIADNLTRFFLVAILKLYSYMANEKKFLFDYDFKMPFLDQLEEHLKKNKDEYENEPYIELFHNALNLFLSEKTTTYHKLRNTLNRYYDRLENIDRKNMYVVLANFCSERIRKGDTEFIKEKYNLYKEILDRKAQYEPGGFIHHVFYKRVVSNAVDLQKLDWAEKFIEQYKDDISTEYRESNYNYCIAMVNYGKKNYGKALEMLAKVRTSDISYKIEIRSLLLMIYYDTMESDSFDSTVDSFRHLVSNNRLVSSAWQERERNFINFTKRLFDLKMKVKKDEFSLKKILEEIDSCESLQNRYWLRNRAKELKSPL